MHSILNDTTKLFSESSNGYIAYNEYPLVLPSMQAASEVFIAEIPIRSPQKLLIFII